MPFLDTIITTEHNRTLSISVCRKSTQINQYLQWDSHHHIAANYSVINTLAHRARAVCCTAELFRTEKYLREVLTKCKYPLGF